jgi:U3 small nucleolar RNA-associated protein 14
MRITYVFLILVKAGWGDWAGPGETGIAQSTLRKRDRMIKRVEAESAEKRSLRKDSKIYNVMISDRRIKSASKFKIAEIPHPFTSREEYEQSLRLPVGGT